MSTTACRKPSCPERVHLAAEYCPVCGEFAGASNVRHAELPEEKKVLEERYQRALSDAHARGADAALEAFLITVRGSQAVLAMWSKKFDGEFLDGTGLYSTYYAQVAAELRTHGDPWDAQRRIADEALFPGYKEKVRFAALSLDDRGLGNYGDCFFVLREENIADRASVLDEDGLHFAQKHRYALPPGYRAPWLERAKLAVAKLAGQVEPTTPVDQFPAILMVPGRAKSDDQFIEVHIWGPMSIRTFSRAVITHRVGRAIFRKRLQERFAKISLPATIDP